MPFALGDDTGANEDLKGQSTTAIVEPGRLGRIVIKYTGSHPGSVEYATRHGVYERQGRQPLSECGG